MVLLTLSEERRRAEVARAEHVERLVRLERREAFHVMLACMLFLGLEVFMLGLSMHLTGTGALWALAGGAACGVGPAATIILWQIKRERGA